MKNVASNFSQLEKLKFTAVSIILSIICIGFFVYGIVTSQSNYIFNAIFFTIFAFLQFQFMTKTVFQLADEVWDTGTSLKIKRKNLEEEISYQLIKTISYDFKPLISFKNPCIEIQFKEKTLFGHKICFISWADMANYQTELKFYPHKTSETLAWVEKIKKKSSL